MVDQEEDPFLAACLGAAHLTPDDWRRLPLQLVTRWPDQNPERILRAFADATAHLRHPDPRQPSPARRHFFLNIALVALDLARMEEQASPGAVNQDLLSFWLQHDAYFLRM